MIEQKFKRQILLKDIGTPGQEKIRDSKILIIGMGGLGHPALAYLCSMGVGTFGICDYDNVEFTNLHRQTLFGESDVGRPKIEVAKEKIQALSESSRINTYNEKITAENILSIVRNYDIILDCTDNLKTKFLIHDTCFLIKKVLVQASIYQYEGEIKTFDFTGKNREKSPCLRCLWPKVIDDSFIKNCAEAGVLGGVPGVFGTLQALEVVKYLTNLPHLQNGESLLFDLLNYEALKQSWDKNSKCPLCSLDNARIKNIDPEEYRTKQVFELELPEINSDEKSIFIDLRNENEREFFSDFSRGFHPKASVLIWEEAQATITWTENNRYVFFCEKGIRSKKIVEKFRRNGHQNIFSLHGGLKDIKG